MKEQIISGPNSFICLFPNHIYIFFKIKCKMLRERIKTILPRLRSYLLKAVGALKDKQVALRTGVKAAAGLSALLWPPTQFQPSQLSTQSKYLSEVVAASELPEEILNFAGVPVPPHYSEQQHRNNLAQQFEAEVSLIIIIITTVLMNSFLQQATATISQRELKNTKDHSAVTSQWLYFPSVSFFIGFPPLNLPMLYLALMISNVEGKIGHWILLMHGTLTLCPCRWFVLFLSPTITKTIHSLPLSLHKSRAASFFKRRARYPLPNELGGLHRCRNICQRSRKKLSDMFRVDTAETWVWNVTPVDFCLFFFRSIPRSSSR